MRLFLLTLTIALLPLRGWMGDVMVLERSIPERQTILAVSVQDKCHEPHAHNVQEEAATPDTSSHAEDDCGGCTACQICHTLALTATLLPAPLAQFRLRQPPDPARLHSSADLRPGLRPPIVQA